MSAIATLLLLLPFATPSFGAPAASESVRVETCDSSVRHKGSRTSISSHDSDDRNMVIDYLRVKDDRCTSATIVGRLTYSTAEDDIIAMPFGGHGVFRERSSSVDRALSFTRGVDGGIIRSYQENGRNANYDGAARQWFAAFLPQILADAGVNVEPRVARWRSEGGVDRALSKIAELGSSGARRSHYVALLDGGRLSNDEHERVLRGVGQNFRDSSGDLRHVLSRAAPRFRVSNSSVAALENALRAMPSSGDKRTLVELYADTDDREMLLAMMRVARTIPSSGDNARLLRTLAPRYLAGNDRDLQEAFFGVARTIPSSGDARRVLEAAVEYAPKSPDITHAIIDHSRAVPSSGDRTAILIALVRSGAVRGRDLQEAFAAAVETIPSEGDRNRVLMAVSR